MWSGSEGEMWWSGVGGAIGLVVTTVAGSAY